MTHSRRSQLDLFAHDLLDDMETDAGGHQQDLDISTVRRKDEGAPAMATLDDMPVPEVDLSKLRPYPVRGTPRPHQARALIEADLRPGHCYFVDPGGGKTFLCIAEAGALWEAGEISGVMIFAPNGVHVQWIEEQFPEWCDVPFHAGHNQMTPKRLGEFMDRCGGKFRLDVYAVNYDALHTPKGNRAIREFVMRNPRFMLIIDESHYAKSWEARRTVETMRWALHAAYRRVLSGTPLLRGLEDLWSQYEIAIPGLAWPHEPIRFDERQRTSVNTYGFLGFRTHHCIVQEIPNPNPRAKNAKMIVGYRYEDELKARVAPHVTRVKASEFAVMEAPDVIPIHTPMSEPQARAYREMKTDLVATLDSGNITAQNALVQLGKLLQIASGFLYDQPSDESAGYDRSATWTQIGTNKIDATMNLLEQLEERVIVWAPFRALQQGILEAVAERNARRAWRNIYDYSSMKDAVARWREDPLGILLGNQGSGMGVGLNLQAGAANIYTANTFSAGARWQSVKRTDRMGQERQVRIWDLVAPDTKEMDVMKALAKREDLSRRNIDGLREFLRS